MMPVEFDPQPLTLCGPTVRLEPFEQCHLPDLLTASANDEVWRYLPITCPASLEDLESWAKEAVQGMADGSQVPFTIVLSDSGKGIGSTRYLDIQRPHR